MNRARKGPRIMTENKTVPCSMQGACLWPTTSDCEIRRFEVGKLKIQSKTAVMIFKNFLKRKVNRFCQVYSSRSIWKYFGQLIKRNLDLRLLKIATKRLPSMTVKLSHS